MSDASRATGGCLCGAVRFDAHVPTGGIQACHCRQCRRWTGGGPLFSVRVEDIRLTGADRITAYHHSGHGERATCATCGTILYWRTRGRPITYVAAGALDDQDALHVSEEIFADRRAPWMAPWPGARQTTEAHELEQLARHLNGDTP